MKISTSFNRASSKFYSCFHTMIDFFAGEVTPLESMKAKKVYFE